MKLPFFILLLIGCISICTLCSWEVRYPKDHPQYQQTQPSLTFKAKPVDPPYDYGDRTQLSAFILCLFIGYLGAHHWYMNNFTTAGIQLGLFLVVALLIISQSVVGFVFGFLFAMALAAWILVDLMLIAYRAIRPKSRRELIPWDTTIRSNR